MTISWKEKMLYAVLALAVLGLVVAYVLEFYYFKRTFGIKNMSMIAAGIGAADGALLGWVLNRKARETVEGIQLYMFCIVLTALFAPLLASLSNRLLSPHPVKMERVVFFEERPYVSEMYGIMKGEKIKPRGYFLFFMREGKLERIDNRRPMAVPLQRGDTFEIPVRKGLWGVEWVVAWP